MTSEETQCLGLAQPRETLEEGPSIRIVPDATSQLSLDIFCVAFS